MKAILVAGVFAVLVVFIQAHKRKECPSRSDIQLLDTDYLNKATVCPSGNWQCQRKEKCCRTPSGPRCLDLDKTYEELNSDQEKDDDVDCDDDEDENHKNQKGKSKCHKHSSVNPIIIVATFLVVVLFFIVTLTFVRKFCSRSRGKISNSQTDLNSVGLKGRASDYAVQSNKRDVDRASKPEKGQERLSWIDTTSPPPYFMSPSAPPPYTVDPPPKYQKQNSEIEKTMKY
ncbi:uncharacterized protein LOC111121606 [Crassostrea virginica]